MKQKSLHPISITTGNYTLQGKLQFVKEINKFKGEIKNVNEWMG
jgi:hypothetical protein